MNKKEKQIKLRRVTFDTTNFMKKIIPEKLEKDLYPDEQICKACGGIGLVVNDYPFYIWKDDSFFNRIIKYKKNIKFCPDCFNGVQKLCEFCGKVKPKNSYRCDCDGYKREQDKKEREKIAKQIDEAKKVKLKDCQFEMLFEPYSSQYFTIDEIYDLKYDQLSTVMFGTEKISLNMDAVHILENSLDDYREDAWDFIEDKEVDRLQKFLDEWCDKQKISSYYPNYRIVVDLE